MMKSGLRLNFKIPALLFVTALVVSGARPASPESLHHLGPAGPYLGQFLPDTVPELFAPGIVSTGMFTRDMAISPDGKEIFFCVALGNYAFATILHCSETGGHWSLPEIVPFSGGPGIIDFEPAFSHDGSRLFFLSTRPDAGEEAGDQDIWYVERRGTGWSDPVNLGEPVNTDGGEYFPSLTRDGTLYFTRNVKGSSLNMIFRSRFVDGAFREPKLLPPQVNCGTNRFNAFVAPDESYIIVPAAGMKDAYDGVDYYIVFRNSDDRWSEPLNMGPLVNQGNEGGWSPFVSPDGKIFFFMATFRNPVDPDDWNYRTLKELYNNPGNGNACIYWMDASFIRDLRKQARFP
jgi:hypothetical protein